MVPALVWADGSEEWGLRADFSPTNEVLYSLTLSAFHPDQRSTKILPLNASLSKPIQRPGVLMTEACSFDNPGAFPSFESTSVPAVRDETKLRRSVADAHDQTFGLVCGMSDGGDTSLSNLGCHQVPQGVKYCT